MIESAPEGLVGMGAAGATAILYGASLILKKLAEKKKEKEGTPEKWVPMLLNGMADDRRELSNVLKEVVGEIRLLNHKTDKTNNRLEIATNQFGTAHQALGASMGRIEGKLDTYILNNPRPRAGDPR